MGVEKVNLNLSALNDITPPNISIGSNAKEFLQNLSVNANTLTHGYLPHILLGGVFALLYLILADKSPFGEFKYSDLRAFTLTSGIVSMLGLTLLEIGFFNNLYVIGLTTTLFIIGNIVLVKTNTQ